MIKKIGLFITFMVSLFVGVFKKVLPVIHTVLIVSILTVMTSMYKPTEVNATESYETTIAWQLENYTGTTYRLNGFSLIPESTDTITIKLPSSYVYKTRTNTANRSRILFYDASDNLLGTYYLEDWADYIVQEQLGNEYDYYDFDLQALGLQNVGVYGEPYKFIMIVELHSDVGNDWDSAERTSFLSYVNSNTEYTVYFENPDYRDFYFIMESGYYDSSVYAGSYYYVPELAGAVKMTWNNIDNSCLPFISSGINDSYIKFYAGVTYSDTYDLKDYTYFEPSSNVLETPDYGVFIPFPNDYSLGDYTDYEIVLYTDRQISNYCMNELNNNLKVDFLSYFTKVNFYDGDTLYSSQLVRFDQLVEEPARPIKEGHDFVAWVIPSTDIAFRSQVFDFDALLDAELIDNSTLNIYAQWRALTITDETGLDDSTPVEGNILTVLEGFGLDSTSGRVILYFGVVLIVSAIMMFKNLGGMATLLVVTVITTIFSALGFLPAIVLVLVFTILIGAGITVFNLGGGTSE